MLIFLSLFFWLCLPVADAQTGQKIDQARLPSVAATVLEFAPPGWMIETQTEGDLNRDNVPDLAVTLVEKMPADADKENPPERQRALLILFKTSDGKFSRAALAEKVLLCTRCGGAFFGVAETPSNVAINNGVIVIKQEYGSREVTQETLRFRYDPEVKRIVFIGVDVKSYDRLTGQSVTESANFLTNVKLTTKSKVNPKTDKETPVSNTRQRVSFKKKFIEAVAAPYSEQEEK
jgi:hypothetical protein